MSTTTYASLVRNALNNRRRRPSKIVASLKATMPLRRFDDLSRAYAPWAQELAEVNEHITVRPDEIEAAVQAYEEVAQHLRQALDWPEDATQVFPQGSASTRTLIRSPNGGEKFDIDAVCVVDVTYLDTDDPIGFFNRVGEALQAYQPTAKNRCWNIGFAKQPFYLEFTPSIPLATTESLIRECITHRLIPLETYRETALAVVDRKTEQWKPSNPQGVTQWVNEAAKLQLLHHHAVVALEALREAAGVKNVPDQEIAMADTLRLAIRLFKRHRDISTRRGRIEKDYQPISIILVTLLTACYIGLHENQSRYEHPIELLLDLAELLPWMVDHRDGAHWVANPTVEGENFAEKWNEQGGQHHQVFREWCDILALDLWRILTADNPTEIRRQVCEVFGVPASPKDPTSSAIAGLGLGGTKPTRRPPKAPPKVRGLA